ncbi:HAD-IB family hydrolase [Helicobacter equorum]|uniref:HAD-IB family hydrolase n=1 Tax=Helicobacter equorum TaxID=361872 RepID=UPI000CF125C9|nr:HAD-IB family hydrolase [Helicobacter equorum]
MQTILAIFDFCETLVSIQSIPPYLEMVGKENPHYNARMLRLQQRILPRLHRYTKIPLFDFKAPRYPQLKGMDMLRAQELAKEYVQKELIYKTNEKVLKRLRFHQESGHTIIIVSGGLEIYITEFAKLFGIKNIVAISLQEQNGILNGEMDGIHTMEHRKLYKLTQMFDMDMFDLQNSYVYSDCPSDIPLLSFVGNGVAIECGKDIQWAKIMGYKIL